MRGRHCETLIRKLQLYSHENLYYPLHCMLCNQKSIYCNMSMRATTINVVRTNPDRTNTLMSILHIVEK